MATFEDFLKLDMRVGKIIDVELLENAKYTTHKLTIDFGDIGRKVSCARLINYTKEQLIGRLVICAINLPQKQIGNNISECLTLGVPNDNEECILLQPSSDAPLGGKVY